MGGNVSKFSTVAPAQAPQPVLIASALHPDAWADLDCKLSGSSIVRTKERIQCLCEGGRYCHNEDPGCQQTQSPFSGLHSSWVTSKVLAMARPWQENLLKHNIAQILRDEGIGMVLNLQEVGEHAHCGRGVLPSSGFSYDPETFMAAGIGVYNFSWRDMGIPSLHKMMDIVQVMVHVTEEEQRKVAVHCHAGLGRTGLAIACYLVFLGECSAHEAVLKVRRGRPGALQTHQQEQFVEAFQMYLTHLRCVFQTGQSADTYTSSPQCAAVQPISNESASSRQVHHTHSHEDHQTAAHGAPQGEALSSLPNSEHGLPAELGFTSAIGPPQASDIRSRAAWTEQINVSSSPDCSTARRSETTAVIGDDASISVSTAISASMPQAQPLAVPAASEQKHRLFKAPWPAARGSEGPGQVHGVEPGRSAASRCDVMWSEDGFMKAGFRPKGQGYRASPPAHLQEALARQRHLLHGQDLRNYWNLPKVVDMLASALEHVVQGRCYDRTLCGTSEQQEASAFGSASNQPSTSSSVAAELAEAVAGSVDKSVMQAADVIALQVNSGKLDTLTTSSSKALMQLLNKWFHSFEEPILSSSQQRAISDIMGTHTKNSISGMTIVLPSSLPTQDSGSRALDVLDSQNAAANHVALADVREPCADQYAAIAELLSVPQRLLMARLVKCFRTVAGAQADNSSDICLMRWLASALTAAHVHDQTSAEVHAALVLFLSRCDVSQLLPVAASQRQSAAETHNSDAAVSGNWQAQKQAPLLNAVPTDDQGPVLLTAEALSCPQKAQAPDSCDMVGEGRSNEIPMRHHDAWDNEQGCLWLHTRMAKNALVRILTPPRRTEAAA